MEAAAAPSFAFRYWANVENMTADPGVERIETDRPYLDRPGIRGKTYHTSGGSTDWVVAEVEPERRLVIDMALPDATLQFELTFEERAGGGSVLTQRVRLFGPNAAVYLEQVKEGFGTSLRDGMTKIRDRIDDAATRQ